MLPQISRSDYLAAENAGFWDRFYPLYDAYLSAALDEAGRLNISVAEAVEHLYTPEQQAFLAYADWGGQVDNGGFVQWLANGYAEAAFALPLTPFLREWGADGLAEIFAETEAVCRSLGNAFPTFDDWKGFAELYGQPEMQRFEPLQARFLAISESEEAKIGAYLDRHIGRFAEMV